MAASTLSAQSRLRQTLSIGVIEDTDGGATDSGQVMGALPIMLKYRTGTGTRCGVKNAPRLSDQSAHQPHGLQSAVVRAFPSTHPTEGTAHLTAPNSKWDKQKCSGVVVRKGSLSAVSVGKRHRDIIPTGCLAGYQKRPRTDRRRALDLDQVRSLVNAASFAAAQGRSLNALLTITWGATKQFSDQNWNVIQTQMFDKLSRFLKRRGVPTAFVWTRERVPGIGAHTHVLLHLGPQAETLKPLVLAYLTNIYNFSRNGVDISMGKFGANTAASQAGLLRYIAKGIDHRAFRYIGMDGETENIGVALGVRHRGQQGIVQIKRAGTSQSIGSAARRQAGWMEIRDLVALNRALNPGGRDAAEDG